LRKQLIHTLKLLLLVSLVAIFGFSETNGFTGIGKEIFESENFISQSNSIQFTLEDGLISNQIYTINQDSLGYIWIATHTGLSRYNGSEFYNFTTNNGLKKNETVALEKTDSKRIWMLNNGPMGYIENGTLNYLENNIKQKMDWNFSVEENSDSIWVTYNNEFLLIFKKSNSYKKFSNGDFCKNRQCLIFGRYNNQLIACSLNNIYIFKNEHLQNTIALDHDNAINHKIIFAKYKDGVFFTHMEKLVHFDFKTKKIRKYNIKINDAARFKCFDDKLVIVFLNGGLQSLKIKNNLDVELGKKVNTDLIFTDIFRDKDLNYWFATSSKGVFFIPKKLNEITNKQQVADVALNALNCMFLDGDSIWIGTNQGEIILLYNNEATKKNLPFRNPNAENRVLDILKLDKNNILIAGDGGLFMLVDNELKHLIYTAGKKISVVKNTIYLNTYKGIFKVDKDCLLQLILNNQALCDDVVFDKQVQNNNTCLKKVHAVRSYQTCFVNEKDVFVYEPANGLINYTIEGDTFINKKIIKTNIDITDLLHYKNNIFVATAGNGILNYDLNEDEITSFNTINNSIIHSLDFDIKTNTLYAASNKGLYLIKLNEEGFEDEIITITKNKGLLSNEIAEVILSDTSIVAISNNGINFIEKKINTNFGLPSFAMEQLFVNENNIPLKNNYEFEANQNNLSISYNKIDLNNIINTKFAYKQNDEPWHYRKKNSLDLLDLKHGYHKLKFGLVTNKNEKPQKYEEFNFYIKPMFSQTKWAKFIFGLFFLLLVLLSSNYFFTQKNLRILEKQVEKRTKQLQTKMQELDEVNSKLKTKNESLNSYTYLVSHDLKAPLYNISSFLNIIFKKNKDKFDKQDEEYFGFINEGLQSMIDKVNDLLKYSKVRSDIDLRTLKQINLNDIVAEVKRDFKFEIEKKNIKFLIEPNLPKVKLEKTSAQLLFQNLISNSIKYNISNKPLIEIYSKINKNNTTIFVKDNGIGISENYQHEAFKIFSRGHNNEQYDGTGIGLAICKKIMDAHSGFIKLSSEKNKGCIFSIIFPNVT